MDNDYEHFHNLENDLRESQTWDEWDEKEQLADDEMKRMDMQEFINQEIMPLVYERN